MTKREQGPDKFQWDGFSAGELPAAADVAAAAVRRFVQAFVIPSKHERMTAMLLHSRESKRDEAFESLHSWLDPDSHVDMPRATGFPQHLHARFGNLRGILVGYACSHHVSIAGAAILAAKLGSAAIFMADARPLGLLFHEIGPPTLCSAP
ncbi:MAG TPA: hypothetical protein VK427_03390 [Kofleriaceae bacterium]|nr:hypothetical protein [Kofleriaceae bacterium]